MIRDEQSFLWNVVVLSLLFFFNLKLVKNVKSFDSRFTVIQLNVQPIPIQVSVVQAVLVG